MLSDTPEQRRLSADAEIIHFASNAKERLAKNLVHPPSDVDLRHVGRFGARQVRLDHFWHPHAPRPDELVNLAFKWPGCLFRYGVVSLRWLRRLWTVAGNAVGSHSGLRGRHGRGRLHSGGCALGSPIRGLRRCHPASCAPAICSGPLPPSSCFETVPTHYRLAPGAPEHPYWGDPAAVLISPGGIACCWDRHLPTPSVRRPGGTASGWPGFAKTLQPLHLPSETLSACGNKSPFCSLFLDGRTWDRTTDLSRVKRALSR
jgi:hypothetical protein